jgi:hypothetical protein
MVFLLINFLCIYKEYVILTIRPLLLAMIKFMVNDRHGYGI